MRTIMHWFIARRTGHDWHNVARPCALHRRGATCVWSAVIGCPPITYLQRRFGLVYQNMCSVFHTLGCERLVRNVRIKKCAVGQAGNKLNALSDTICEAKLETDNASHKYYMQIFPILGADRLVSCDMLESSKLSSEKLFRFLQNLYLMHQKKTHKC